MRIKEFEFFKLSPIFLLFGKLGKKYNGFKVKCEEF